MGEAAKQSVEQPPKKKKFSSPHAFVILSVIILITAISTYFIPAGEFERITNDTGQTLVVEGTYESKEPNPSGIMDLFKSIHAGMMESAHIIFFIFIVGGSFYIFRSTQTIEAVLGSISSKIAGKEILLIPVVMIFFGLAGGTFGMFEEAFPFILVLVPIAVKLGFDSIVGTGIVLVGVSSGFTAAFTNPFTIGVAQDIADIPIFSGMGLRIVYWFIFMAVSVVYVMLYAKKVKDNPQKSILHVENEVFEGDIENATLDETVLLNKRQVVTLIVLVLSLVVLAYGVLQHEWFIPEIAALFLGMGIIVGIINRMKINEIAANFAKGCQELVVGALVVGFAYAVLVILEDSNTIDSILYAITQFISEVPSQLAAMGMYITQSLMNFIVTSGSGQAALTMPIMTPLADLLEVNRQTAVLAFQMGDGISNIIAPTSGLLLAGLAMAGVPYGKWFKWVLPLILIHYVLGAIFITIAHLFIWV